MPTMYWECLPCTGECLPCNGECLQCTGEKYTVFWGVPTAHWGMPTEYCECLTCTENTWRVLGNVYRLLGNAYCVFVMPIKYWEKRTMYWEWLPSAEKCLCTGKAYRVLGNANRVLENANRVLGNICRVLGMPTVYWGISNGIAIVFSRCIRSTTSPLDAAPAAGASLAADGRLLAPPYGNCASATTSARGRPCPAAVASPVAAVPRRPPAAGYWAAGCCGRCWPFWGVDWRDAAAVGGWRGGGCWRSARFGFWSWTSWKACCVFDAALDGARGVLYASAPSSAESTLGEEPISSSSRRSLQLSTRWSADSFHTKNVVHRSQRSKHLIDYGKK